MEKRFGIRLSDGSYSILSPLQRYLFLFKYTSYFTAYFAVFLFK